MNQSHFQAPPTVDAGAGRRGLMSTIAQIFAGAKTFNDLITGQAGLVISGDAIDTVSILCAHDIVSFSGDLYCGTVYAAQDVQSGSGSATEVAFGPQADRNTGFWFPAADTINVTVGGVLQAQFTTGSVTFPSGSRVINVPSIVLPGGSGGYGYGGGLEIGGQFNGLSHNGLALYVQAYASDLNLSSFSGQTLLYGGNGAGAFDVTVKLGTSLAKASNANQAKVLSIGSGIGGTYNEMAYFHANPGAFQANMVINTQSQTHVAGIAIINNGAGDTGIFWEAGNSAGGVSMGLGSVGTRGLLTASTNRTQSWSINSGVYSGSARALYDWEANEDAYQKTIPFTRYQADMAHNADMARWYKGTTLLAALSKFGIFTAEGVIANGGLAVNGGGAEILGGVTLLDDKPIRLATFGEDLTTPPIGDLHEITINAAKGRGIFAGTYGTTLVNCDKCTEESVVLVMMEEEIGGNNPYAVQPGNGFFYIKTDGGGYYDSLFRFIVFN